MSDGPIFNCLLDDNMTTMLVCNVVYNVVYRMANPFSEKPMRQKHVRS